MRAAALLLALAVGCSTPEVLSRQADFILVDKSDRTMTLYSRGAALKTYTGLQLGGEPLGPKRFEGDERTPEGRYAIDARNPASAYHLSLRISYPSEADHAYAAARRRMIEARGRIENLSAREREVLDWLAQGSSNKTIARELDISPRTVEIHRANMMSKLGASHAAEAVRLRIEAGL